MRVQLTDIEKRKMNQLCVAPKLVHVTMSRSNGTFQLHKTPLQDLKTGSNLKEDIWYENLPESIYDSHDDMKASFMRTRMGPLKRPNVVRKTQIRRKINPQDCSYPSIGIENIFINWSLLKVIKSEEIEAFYNETKVGNGENATLTLAEDVELAKGHKRLHLIDYYDYADSMHP